MQSPSLGDIFIVEISKVPRGSYCVFEHCIYACGGVFSNSQLCRSSNWISLLNLRFLVADGSSTYAKCTRIILVYRPCLRRLIHYPGIRESCLPLCHFNSYLTQHSLPFMSYCNLNTSFYFSFERNPVFKWIGEPWLLPAGPETLPLRYSKYSVALVWPRCVHKSSHTLLNQCGDNKPSVNGLYTVLSA